MGSRRLVTLTGAGGIGKTQTALQLATLAEASGTPVSFVGLAPIVDSELVLRAVASALGVQEVPSRPLIDTLVTYLNNKPLLLILDNCEHVVGELAQIAEMVLLRCPQVRILATSREPLAAAGERTYRLPPLAASDAIALFSDRAQAIDARFAVDERNGRTIAEICRRLDGIPLAIELAAAHVDSLSADELAVNLDDHLRILTIGRRTAPPRQQTMRATIDWSYNLLSAEEQRVFERLSAFIGGCTLATAKRVCSADDVPHEDILGILSSLIRKSLVLADVETAEARFSMLESFRQYARAKLVDRGEEHDVARRHALASLDVAEWFNLACDSVNARLVRESVLHEPANWRAALQWALAERNDVVLGQRLAGTLGPCFDFFLATARNAFFFGHAEGRRWIREALALVDEMTPSNAVAELNWAEARIAGSLQEYASELRSSQVALKHFRAAGNVLGTVRAQAMLGHALLYLGRTREARAALAEALPRARELGDRSRFTYAFLLRLSALASEHDPAGARGQIAEALEIHKELAHVSSVAMALLDLSECELSAGNLAAALERATESLAAAPAGNPFVRCTALYAVSQYQARLDRYDEAMRHAREALELAREYHFAVYVARCLGQIVTIEALCKDAPQLSTEVCGRTARVLGFVNARLTALGSARLPSVQPRYQRVFDRLQARLGGEALSERLAEGASLTEDLAVEDALTP
jgi:predicted ATPase